MCMFTVKSSVVTTGVGDIIGETATVNINNTKFQVDTYLGIPYAKPPVDNLRFSKPEPLEALDSPYNATKYSSACWQFTTFPGAPNPLQSEDCLYLKVFVPRRNDSTMKYAVLVYIHGGGFEWGSSDLFDGKYLAAYGGIITVTFNYRLRLLGFVHLDNVEAPGNVGIWDQRLVLEWVNNNIESFGGVKDNVTILGTSAGAASATIHGLYLENKGLFQRVIAQGGSIATMEYNLQTGNTPETNYILKSLGCTFFSTSDTLECLRNIPASNLTADVKNYSIEIHKNMLRNQFYVPIIDGTLIKWNSRDLTRTDDEDVVQSVEFFRSLDFLNGFSKYDAGFIFQQLLKLVDAEQFRPTKDDMEKIVETALRMSNNKTFSDLVYKLIMSEYTNSNDPTDPESIRLQVVRLYTDIVTAVPAIYLSKIHDSSTNSSQNNYMFLFTAKSSLHVLSTPSWLDGANHADELLYLTVVIDQLPFAKQWEKQLSYKMMKYWSNFVKTGNPNGVQVDDSNLPNWPRYGLKSQEDIDLDKNITARAYRNARDFWLDLLPGLLDNIKKGDCPECPSCTSAAPSAKHDHVVVYRQLLITISVSLLFLN